MITGRSVPLSAAFQGHRSRAADRQVRRLLQYLREPDCAGPHWLEILHRVLRVDPGRDRDSVHVLPGDA